MNLPGLSPLITAAAKWMRGDQVVDSNNLIEAQDLHNTNPEARARLTIQIETHLGPRTVITSNMPRIMASAISEALSAKSITASVIDDRGVHTVADLVKRKRAREKRKTAVGPSGAAVVQMRRAGK
jgi:hypothetical protein